jgi:hypothetical protein
MPTFLQGRLGAKGLKKEYAHRLKMPGTRDGQEKQHRQLQFVQEQGSIIGFQIQNAF